MARHENRAAILDRLRARTLDGPGSLDAAVRRAAFTNDHRSLSDSMSIYVDNVHRHAYKIIDRDVDALRAEGLEDDQVFELTIAAAVGAGLERLDAAHRAMRGESA
ncbi:MAG: hypothetical protein JO265_08600 [Acidimicrobiia bacterium]|nr:hypothetical protein [Acidimicrobiia bacterium]